MIPPSDFITRIGAGHADGAQMFAQPAEIAADHRAEIGVDDRRAGPLVFADDRQEIAGTGQEDVVAQPLVQDGRDLPLMVRVGIGVQQAHGDRLNPGRRQPVRRGLDACPVERAPDLAFRPDPFVRLQTQPPRHQRLRTPVVQRVHFRDAQAPHLQHVAEAACGDEPGQRSLALQHGVGRHRRAVHHPPDGRRFEPEFAEQRRDAVADAEPVVLRRGETLVGVQGAVRSSEHKVGKGAADIDAEAPREF